MNQTPTDASLPVDRPSVIRQVRGIVIDRMSGQGAGHDADHVLRVWRTARWIQRQTGGDAFVVELAALLHDIGDAKFHQGIERSGVLSKHILATFSVPADVVDQVVHIVDNISFRKAADPNTLSIEAKIVQDADRLDALGAIGIVRTIEYGAVKGQPFHRPGCDDPSKSGIGHFHEKLFKLRGLLNTEAAKQIAEERETFMRDFLAQFLSECDTAGDDAGTGVTDPADV
ncbi:HD domain-containing protein [Crateriforma conspicua]|uniref:Putative hydrolase n=1 Tax=Crateriforma conspicua TaxID=2527996 RepID=A0A5C5Y559_9PLAN|nr:HD domain-containing protein [Crateriforma conspicua]QDV64369.1 putative hydrolase [Crateriforma conspicua]TWT69771.1 putative hydrolase [Crateriforma conspicua]